jgi:hypothetical protein
MTTITSAEGSASIALTAIPSRPRGAPSGLSSAEAHHRHAEFGPNEIRREEAAAGFQTRRETRKVLA